MKIFKTDSWLDLIWTYIKHFIGEYDSGHFRSCQGCEIDISMIKLENKHPRLEKFWYMLHSNLF